jgi:type I restriction-modification system DNA methylase subunit
MIEIALHELIKETLIKAKHPLTIKEIVDQINTDDSLHVKSNRNIETNHIYKTIRKYSKIFHNINGLVILTEDEHWNKLLRNIWYIGDQLRLIKDNSELQYIIAVLLFLKRSKDLKSIGFNFPIIPPKLLFEHFNFINEHELNIFYLEIKELDYQIPYNLNIFSEFIYIFSKLPHPSQLDIIYSINQVDTNYFSDFRFGNVFEYFIKINSKENTRSSSPDTPLSIKQLIIGLLDPKVSGTVYDPICGIGSLLVEASKHSGANLHVIGSEKNSRVAQLAYMNLLMHGVYNFHLKINESVMDMYDSHQYDYVIANLPLTGATTTSLNSYIIQSYERGNVSSHVTSFSLEGSISLIYSKLKKEGKAAFIIPESFLFKKGKTKDFRRFLTHEDIIECIVSLPNGSLRPYTEAKSSIIVFNRQKETNLRNKIKFIRARAVDGDSKSLDINIDEVLNLYLQNEIDKSDNNLIEIIDSTLLDEDYNLSIDSLGIEYSLANKMLVEGAGKLLGDLVEIKTGVPAEKVTISIDGQTPYVKIENLSRDILDVNLYHNGIHDRILSSQNYLRSTIEEEAILIAKIGENLKPTLFQPSMDVKKIIIHKGVYALTRKSVGNKINLEYLYYQLHSSFVQDQIKKRRTGSVMPFISVSTLKQLIIPYMDINSQDKYIASQKASLIATEKAKMEEKIKALGYKEEVIQKESDIVRTLVHQLRPSLANIDFHVKKIQRIVRKHDLAKLTEFEEVDFIHEDPELEAIIDKPYNYSLEEIVNKLSNDSLQLNDVLTTVNKVMSFKLDPTDFETIDLLNFVRSYIELKKMDKSKEYEIDVKGENFEVLINTPSFKELIDQLIINAEKHAFNIPKSAKSYFRITFNIKRNKNAETAIIEYHNNGRPYLLSQDDFVAAFHKGQSSNGSGIGGNYIYRIVQAHRGELAIKENLKTGFSMSIELPIKKDLINE